MKNSKEKDVKRVCSITHEYFPRDRRVLKQAKALVDAGCQVDVLTIRNYADGEKKEDRYDSIRIYRIPLSKKRGSKLRYFFEFIYGFFLFSVKLNLLFLKNRYDIIQINNIPNFYVFTAIIPKLCGKKIVLDMHELLAELFLHRYKLRSDSLFYRMLILEEKLSVRFSDHVITVTDSLAEIIRARNNLDSVPVVMNTANPIEMSNEVERNGFDPDKLKMVFHGILTNTYRMTVVIDALEKLNESKDFEFHIFGDGSTYSYLQSYIRDKGLDGRIFLEGFLEDSKIAKKAHEFDLAIVPLDSNIYSQYAFASKASQYISMGIPILCSDVKCMRNYYDDDAMIYFNLNDTDELVEKIIYFDENKEELGKKMTDSARQQNEKITWKVMEERYLSVLNGQTGRETVVEQT